MNPTCRCCDGALEVLLDLGQQPVCSHFQPTRRAEVARHPLALAACRRCGQLQLPEPAPVALLRPPHAWISYIEPEGHLDRLVDDVCALPGAGPQWRVGGVTYKDTSTLERLRKRGWQDLWQLDPVADLGMEEGASDLATMQERLTPERARRAAARHGRADVLLVRHILEHTHRTAEFLVAVRELVAPGGVAVFECPDSQRAFAHRDFTVLWEEHLWYFTPATFARFFAPFGMRLERVQVRPYAVENSLMAFVRPHEPEDLARAPSPVELEDERRQMRRYADEFPKQKQAWQAWARSAGKIAAFGAGHATCAFINFFELGPYVEFVADDHPKKQGLFLPGCGVPIGSSARLQEDAIAHCLLGLSPESEARVLARQDAAVRHGVRFASIFATSPHAADAVKQTIEKGRDVLPTDPALARLDDSAFAQLRAGVRGSSHRRNRFCAHAAPTDALHEMTICVHADSYVRPHRHHGRAESLLVLEGFADLVLFTEAGDIERIVRLGPPGAGLTWFVRVPRPIFHTLVLRGEDFIFQETTLGPLRREDTETAPWAPDESAATAVAAYRCELLGAVLTRAGREQTLP